MSPGHNPVPDVALPDTQSPDCRAVADILSRIGDKWTVLIVVLLGAGPRRFNEIKRMVNGISQRMLTLTLKGLERDGLVTRTVTPSIPPRVDYALTELGADLLGPVGELGAWARRHEQCIQAARAKFDASGRRF
ncbi:MAG: winged helix-turn-helix transcriptional regulator [Hyphomonadaceae bacterium]